MFVRICIDTGIILNHRYIRAKEKCRNTLPSNANSIINQIETSENAKVKDSSYESENTINDKKLNTVVNYANKMFAANLESEDTEELKYSQITCKIEEFEDVILKSIRCEIEYVNIDKKLVTVLNYAKAVCGESFEPEGFQNLEDAISAYHNKKINYEEMTSINITKNEGIPQLKLKHFQQFWWNIYNFYGRDHLLQDIAAGYIQYLLEGVYPKTFEKRDYIRKHMSAKVLHGPIVRDENLNKYYYLKNIELSKIVFVKN